MRKELFPRPPRDGTDYIKKFREAGYAFATTAGEFKSAAAGKSGKLLGLFHPGNMDGALDRKFLRAGTVKKYPEQPDLTEQTSAALGASSGYPSALSPTPRSRTPRPRRVLSQNPRGFFLMVESGLIDKFTHALDMERAAYDTIMLDNAVKLASDWAAKRGNDTLILVVADHDHPISLIGTIEDDMTDARRRHCASASVPTRKRASRTIPKRTTMAIRPASMSVADSRSSRRVHPTITRRSGPSSTTRTTQR